MARTKFEPTLDCALACSPGAPAEARREIEELVAAGTLERGLMSDVQLAVSEIVANSVRHSGSREPIRLRIWTRPSGLKVEVADGGLGFEPPHLRPSADAEGGRGLLIVDSLADRWGVSDAAGTRVWFEVGSPPERQSRAQAG